MRCIANNALIEQLQLHGASYSTKLAYIGRFWASPRRGTPGASFEVAGESAVPWSTPSQLDPALFEYDIIMHS